MSKEEEQSRLESIASNSLYAKGLGPDTIRYSKLIFDRYIRGDTILEMGPAEGVMTSLLSRSGKSLTVVEGAKAFCDDLQRRFPAVKVVHSLFENYAPEHDFDNIVLGHVLEHVDDPVAILRRAGSWLHPQGRILAAVPNSRSLHRQAAVIMGLLEREDQLNDLDRHHGHRRVYNPESFRQDFLKAGLDIEVFGGYWLKPLSNGQIEETWTPQMLQAFMQLGERYPDIAGEIYVIARRHGVNRGA
jgi:2-polyprenyl-3-methyl-5-hydroxy-6-metoxy-1,4-benzoquinol methylase